MSQLHNLGALSALIISGGFLHISLIVYLGFVPRTCVILPHVPFLRHYMHRYDLSFGQAGLPGSCIYALRYHYFSQGIRGAPLRLLLPGQPDVYLRLGEAES